MGRAGYIGLDAETEPVPGTHTVDDERSSVRKRRICTTVVVASTLCGVALIARQFGSGKDLRPFTATDPVQLSSWDGFGGCTKEIKSKSMWGFCPAHAHSSGGKCYCNSGYCNNMGSCITKGTCMSDTGHHCNFIGCPTAYGPTDCKRSGWSTLLCHCKPGWCVKDGFCVQQVDHVKADVVALNAQHKKFPGRHGHVKTAICFGGGGSRALVYATGVLRALEDLNLMRKIDAVIACSGSAWALGPYMFSKESKTVLVGSATNPATLTMSNLNRAPSKIGCLAQTNLVKEIARHAASGKVGKNTFWKSVVADKFLKPFGLGDIWSAMAVDHNDVARIVALNPSLNGRNFHVLAPNRPKVFVITGVLLKPRCYHINENTVFGMQMSPDYIGVPFYANNGPTYYSKKRVTLDEGCSQVLQHPGTFVGGGLVESFAFGGPPPGYQGGCSKCQIPAPARPFSLAQAVAASSVFFAGSRPSMGLESVYWGVGSQSQITKVYDIGDGGIMDSIGLHPALQRGARKVIWVVPTAVPITTKRDFCDPSLSSLRQLDFFEPQSSKNAWVVEDVYDKFGLGECKGGFYRCHNQVFDKLELVPFLCDLQRKKRAGGPAIVRRSFKLQTNTYWQIQGGPVVDTLIVYNDKNPAFFSRLPADTRHQIAKGTRGAFASFPHFSLDTQNGALSGGHLTPAQINLLAAQVEYGIRSTESLFKHFLR